MSLSSGACLHCKNAECTRLSGKPCRFQDKMRYSIESLGGNVGKTVTKYLRAGITVGGRRKTSRIFYADLLTADSVNFVPQARRTPAKECITGLLEGFGKEVQLWGFI